MQKVETTLRTLLAKGFITASLFGLPFLGASLQATAQTGASGNTQTGKPGAPPHDPPRGASGTETIKRGTTHTYTGAGRTSEAGADTSHREGTELPQDTVQRGSGTAGNPDTGTSTTGTGSGTTGTGTTGTGSRGTGDKPTRSGNKAGSKTGTSLF